MLTRDKTVTDTNFGIRNTEKYRQLNTETSVLFRLVPSQSVNLCTIITSLHVT